MPCGGALGALESTRLGHGRALAALSVWPTQGCASAALLLCLAAATWLPSCGGCSGLLGVAGGFEATTGPG